MSPRPGSSLYYCFVQLSPAISSQITQMPAKVAVIGAGQVGKTLGGKIARTNPVVYGVRDVSKYADLAAANQTVKPVAEAIKDSDVVILTVPGAHLCAQTDCLQDRSCACT